jgi:hypothetical protein
MKKPKNFLDFVAWAILFVLAIFMLICMGAEYKAALIMLGVISCFLLIVWAIVWAIIRICDED